MDKDFKNTLTEADGELREEYDFSQMSGGVRGKYFEAYQEGTNVVLLAPDVAPQFPSSESVNEALRGLLAQRRDAE